MKLNEAVGLRIEELCKQRGITRYKLCANGGLSRQTICSLGEREGVLLSTIWDVCETLQITLAEFFDAPIFAEIQD